MQNAEGFTNFVDFLMLPQKFKTSLMKKIILLFNSLVYILKYSN